MLNYRTAKDFLKACLPAGTLIKIYEKIYVVIDTNERKLTYIRLDEENDGTYDLSRHAATIFSIYEPTEALAVIAQYQSRWEKFKKQYDLP